MFALGVALLAVGVLGLAIGRWRNARRSDRAMTLIVVSVAPLACLLYALLDGASALVGGL
jgi:hypothetical protein